jgi:hypothetical protein
MFIGTPSTTTTSLNVHSIGQSIVYEQVYEIGLDMPCTVVVL